MSFSDRLVLWLHIGFAVFTIGPVTLAILSTPRYIRQRDTAVLRYLSRITFIFTLGSLGVLLAGLFLGQLLHQASHPWLIVSATLFVVTLVLLLLIVRDQRQAIAALAAVADQAAHDAVAVAPAASSAPQDHPARTSAASAAPEPDAPPGDPPAPAPAPLAAPPPSIAAVERGRIAMVGGVVVLIWLVILVLMVWNS
jgi:predicted lipid-binding transport protein (Tim44 family)